MEAGEQAGSAGGAGTAPGDTGVYTPRPPLPAFEECAFYHTMEIPGHGLVVGQWDLRGTEDAYLGGVEFAGKRVLEVGTADGYLCFHMERMGADVVTHDLSARDSWDLVPYARNASGAPSQADWQRSIAKLNNGYWFAHHAFGSSARACHSSIYDLPEGIGRVDVGVAGSILLHVRDPFLALQRITRLTRETVIVADLPRSPGVIPASVRPALRALRGAVPVRSKPKMTLLPDHRTGLPWNAWWYLPPETVAEFLGILGFEECRLSYSTQVYEGRPNTVYTIVGRRTHEGGLIPEPS